MFKSIFVLCLLVWCTGNSFAEEDCLQVHNFLRAKHSVGYLKFNEKIENYAKYRARKLALTDVFKHPARSRYGENLYWSYGKPTSCAYATRTWYNEIKLYDFENPGFSSSTGHFTQLVWKNTTQIGCASAKSPRTKRVYIACNYYPRGNIVSQFEKNVFPPR